MDVEQFWEIVRKSKRGAGDCDTLAEQLAARLEKLDPQDILAFDQHLRQRLAEAYRWDVWAVAYIINGGSSDDEFEYFRGWLVAQGQEFFGAVLQRPEHAAHEKAKRNAKQFCMRQRKLTRRKPDKHSRMQTLIN